MKTLVLGGSGFVGSNLVPHLRGGGDVVAVDRVPSPNPVPGVRHVVADLVAREDVSRVVTEAEPDVIINLAAESFVHDSFQRANQHFRANAELPLFLSQVLADHDCAPWLIHFSTCEVYGDTGPECATEQTVPEPLTPYAATKFAGESIVSAYGRAGHISSSVLRPFNLFGRHQQGTRLIPRVVAALRAGEEVEVHGDGQQVRDWLYIGELLEVMDLLLARGPLPGGDVLNIAAERPASVNSMVEHVAASLGVDARIRHIPGPPVQIRTSRGDNGKCSRSLGWHSSVDLDEAVDRALNASLVPSG